jgi:hypothetical protein
MVKQLIGIESNKKLGGHPLFYELLEQMADLHSRKNANYAGDDPLSNLKRCQVLNIPPLLGVLVRLQDKWSRIEQLAKGQPDLVGESLEDTLMDSAIYALLAIVLMREASESGTPAKWINPLLAHGNLDR